MNKIIQNEIKCLKCSDIIYSGHRHDFKSCSCGAVSVDGGMDYFKRSGNREDWEERSLLTDLETLKNCIKLVESCQKDGAGAESLSEIIAYEYGDFLSDPIEIWNKLEEAVIWAIENNRNSTGIVLAVIRAMRDNGVLNMEKFNQD